MERIGNGENPNSPNTLLQYIFDLLKEQESGEVVRLKHVQSIHIQL
jgi:hypothetical protein